MTLRSLDNFWYIWDKITLMVGVGIRVMSTCFLFIDNHVFLPTAEQIETIFEKTIQGINVYSPYVVDTFTGFLTMVSQAG